MLITKPSPRKKKFMVNLGVFCTIMRMNIDLNDYKEYMYIVLCSGSLKHIGSQNLWDTRETPRKGLHMNQHF